jgi:hypothetical protein
MRRVPQDRVTPGASHIALRTIPQRLSVALVVFVMATVVWNPAVSLAGTVADCPGYGAVRVTGTVTIDGIDEVSGVVSSNRRPVLWIEEDSGNPELIYAIDGSGAQRGVVTVMNADNRDWEDIALTGRRIWLGDIGDNAEVRSTIRVYWFREPRPSQTSVSAHVLELRYEDGPHNAEAMVVDGKQRQLFIFTKRSGTTSVYTTSVRGLRGGGSATLTKIAELPLKASSKVTAADLGPQGIIIKAGQGYLYRWNSDRTVPSALSTTPCRAEVGPGESLAFAHDGGGLYAIPEGSSPSVYFTPSN